MRLIIELHWRRVIPEARHLEGFQNLIVLHQRRVTEALRIQFNRLGLLLGQRIGNLGGLRLFRKGGADQADTLSVVFV